ncbi:MAG: polysaccharide biosynthesis/export family protein [Candidatus Omnitrophica bacterium]|nr:polysaccharide biosynthesis/export family protein [Candidatus Omnitrophota bacterium]
MCFKNTYNKWPVVTVFVLLLALSTAGCARFKAPKHKLDYSVYSPEGSIASEGQYVIGVRDELDVLIWRCPELDATVTVRPEDGKITLLLIGDVKAAGKTPKEIADVVSEKLAYYVKEPRVAVGVKKFGKKKVFILGQVLMQGSFELDKSARILDLIARAGGFNDNAIPSTTFIVRGGYSNPQIIRVNIARLIHKADTSQNIYLEEGDLMFVPEQEIERINYLLRKVFPSLFFAEKLAQLQQNIMAGAYDWSHVWDKIGKEFK